MMNHRDRALALLTPMRGISQHQVLLIATALLPVAAHVTNFVPLSDELLIGLQSVVTAVAFAPAILFLLARFMIADDRVETIRADYSTHFGETASIAEDQERCILPIVVAHLMWIIYLRNLTDPTFFAPLQVLG